MARLIHNMRIMQKKLPLYEDEQKFIVELDDLVDETLRHMTDPFEKLVPKTEAEKKEAAKAKAKAKRDAAKAGKGVGSLYAAGKILEKEAKLMRRKEQRKSQRKRKDKDMITIEEAVQKEGCSYQTQRQQAHPT